MENHQTNLKRAYDGTADQPIRLGFQRRHSAGDTDSASRLFSTPQAAGEAHLRDWAKALRPPRRMGDLDGASEKEVRLGFRRLRISPTPYNDLPGRCRAQSHPRLRRFVRRSECEIHQSENHEGPPLP